MENIINVWTQFHCEAFGKVGCGWSTILWTIPDWLVTFIYFIPIFGITIWMSWSFIIGKKASRPLWLNLYALIGVVWIFIIFSN